MLCFICGHNVSPFHGNGQKCTDNMRRSASKIYEVITDVIGSTCVITIDENDAVCNTCIILLEEFHKFQKKVNVVSQLLVRQVCRTYNIDEKFEMLDIDQKAMCAFVKNKKNEHCCKHCLYKTKFTDTLTPHFLFHNRDFDIYDEDNETEEEAESIFNEEERLNVSNSDSIASEKLRESKVFKKKPLPIPVHTSSDVQTLDAITNASTTLTTTSTTTTVTKTSTNIHKPITNDDSETEVKVESTIEDELELYFSNNKEKDYDECESMTECSIKEEIVELPEQYEEFDAQSMWSTTYETLEEMDNQEPEEEDIPTEVEYLQEDLLELILCKICGISYTDEMLATEHMKVSHSYCFQCDKMFKDTKLIDRHFRNVHSNIKYKCDICPSEYTNKTGLIKHLKRHYDTAKYQCPYCEKSYYEKGNYNEHLSTHTKSANYVCAECGRTFTNQPTYRLHVRYHETPTPFKCKQCPKAYASASSLAIHRRKAHTGEISHRCEFCGKGFASKGVYKIHQIQHSQIYPYNCEKCKGKGFVKKRDFARHMIKFHDDFSYLPQKGREYKIAIRPKSDE